MPGTYCFTFIDVPSIAAPQHVAGIRFQQNALPQLVVFALGASSMLWWEDSSVKTISVVPKYAAAETSHAITADVQGSAEPDIVLTHVGGASVAPSENGQLGGLVPVGLPDAAFAELGNTFPLDLDGDGQVEYLKGSGKSLHVWRRMADTWQPDLTEFPVPGCDHLEDLAYGDFNADGRRDVAYTGAIDTDQDPESCADPSTHGVAILLQSEVGQLQLMPQLSTGEHKFSRVLSGDLDGDGADDVAALSVQSDDLLIFRSLGDGQFEPPIIIPGVYTYILANIDGDDAAECVIFTKDRSVVFADEVFDELTLTNIPSLSGGPLGAQDLNEDGVDDIAFKWEGVESPTLAIALSNP